MDRGTIVILCMIGLYLVTGVILLVRARGVKPEEGPNVGAVEGPAREENV